MPYLSTKLPARSARAAGRRARRLRRPRWAALWVAAALAGGLGAAASAQPAPLPSAEVPNEPGAVTLTPGLLAPPAVAEQRDLGGLAELWKRAGAAYDVPWPVLAAINKIESNFGANMGPSSAGALGWMQFIPSTWERWGLDADADGVTNPWDPDDAVYSAARYLAAAGASEDISRAIFAYNHADWYVADVLELAEQFGGTEFPLALAPTAPGTATFAVDGLGERLAGLDGELTGLQARAGLARAVVAELRARRATLAGVAADPSLTDAEFHRAERRIAGVIERQRAAEARLGHLRGRIDGTLARLAGLEEEIAAPWFWRESGGGYPLVLAGDTPAAIIGTPGVGTHAQADWQSRNAIDLAAPPGTPVVAVAAGRIVGAGGRPPRAGTVVTATGKRVYGQSVTLQTPAGSFFYAHLDRASVAEGQEVAAGQVLGVVAEWSSGPSHVHFGAETGDPLAAAAAAVAAPTFTVADDAQDEVVTFVRQRS